MNTINRGTIAILSTCLIRLSRTPLAVFANSFWISTLINTRVTIRDSELAKAADVKIEIVVGVTVIITASLYAIELVDSLSFVELYRKFSRFSPSRQGIYGVISQNPVLLSWCF